jgi:hypothetical protein
VQGEESRGDIGGGTGWRLGMMYDERRVNDKIQDIATARPTTMPLLEP